MPVPQSILNAVIEAYYPRSLNAPDSARNRAQAGYAIASAVAAALVAAGAFGDIRNKDAVVQGLGLAAVVAWILAAIFFIRAVASPVLLLEKDQPTAEAFVAAALENARAERDEIDNRQRWARYASIIAALLTLAAIISAVLLPSALASPSVSLTLTGVGSDRKVSARAEIADLPRGSKAEISLFGVSSSGSEQLLLKNESDANAAGKVTISSQMAARKTYTRFRIVATVRKSGRILHEEELVLTDK